MSEAVIRITEGGQSNKIEIHASFYGGMDTEALTHNIALKMISSVKDFQALRHEVSNDKNQKKR